MQCEIWNSGRSPAMLKVLPENLERIISFYSLYFLFPSLRLCGWFQLPILSAALYEYETWRRLPQEFVPLSPLFYFFCWLARISKSAALQRWLKRYHLCPICLLILRYRASIPGLVSHPLYIIRLIRRGRFKPGPGDRNLVPRSAGGRRRSWFTCLLTPALDVFPPLSGDPADPYSADDLNLLEPFKSTGFLLVMSAAVSDRPLTT